jgi:hypothetical protein
MNDPLQRASVTLLIHGDDLVPEELSAILGVQPETGVRKGETFMSRGRPGTAVTARTGMWHFGTGYREPPHIHQQIAELLGSMPEGADTWSDLTTRFDCYVTVGAWFMDDSWTGGLVLEPQTLGMLAERGLAIDFDMYAPGASD